MKFLIQLFYAWCPRRRMLSTQNKRAKGQLFNSTKTATCKAAVKEKIKSKVWFLRKFQKFADTKGLNFEIFKRYDF